MKKLLLMLLLLSLVLTSCNGGNGENTTADGTEDSEITDAPETTETTTAPETEPPIPDGAYKLTVSAAENGSIAPIPSHALFGERIEVSPLPDEGYELSYLLLNDVRINDTSFIMQNKDCVLTPVFKKTVKLKESELVIETSVTHKSVKYTAESHWFAEYKDEGILISVYVKDSNLYSNRTIRDLNKKDEISFAITTSNATSFLTSPAYKFFVSADGYSTALGVASAFSFKDNSRDSGVFVNRDYTVEVCHTTLKENGYNGYFCEIFIKYSAFGLTYDEACGKLMLKAGLRNTVLVGDSTSSASRGLANTVKPETMLIIGKDGRFTEQ